MQNDQNQLAEIGPLKALSIDEISTTDTATLRLHLKHSLGLTVQSISYMALIWRELEERGEDLSALRTNFALFLGQIAAGTLAAEVVVKYAGQRTVIRHLAGLPVQKQLEFVERGTVTIARSSHDGGQLRIDEDVPLEEIPARDLRLIFFNDHVRPLDEQWKLRARQESRPRRKRRATVNIQAAPESDTILVNDQPAKIGSLLKAISRHYGFDVEALIAREAASRKALGSFRGKMK